MKMKSAMRWARINADMARRYASRGEAADSNEAWAFAVAWALKALAGGK